MKNWQQATCPICGYEYDYLPEYKPATCGKHDCIHEANKKGILPQIREKQIIESSDIGKVEDIL